MNLIETAGVGLIREKAFGESMVVGTSLHFVSKRLADLLSCLNDLRTLSLHFFTVQLTDVIQIDVHRETGELKIEEIYGCSTLQSQSFA